MDRHISIVGIAIFFVLGLCSLGFGEEMTITTYYPSPYGSYNELSAYKMKIGRTYSTATVDNDNLIVEGKVSIGTTAVTAQLAIADLLGPGGMNLAVGDDTFFSDIDVANTLGLYGSQNSAVGSLKLGSGGGTISGATNNIGIGTISPAYKLDVVSGGATTARFGTAASDTVIIGGGTGKLTLGVWDPIYTIGKEKYATYGVEMVGLKQETVGLAQVNQRVKDKDYYQFVIDFVKTKKGSDLWLFAKTSNIAQNMDKLVVLLTPKSNTQVWYETNKAKNQLIFYASQPTTLSYRLTAPRFDGEKWPNTAEDSDVAGYILEDSETKNKE